MHLRQCLRQFTDPYMRHSHALSPYPRAFTYPYDTRYHYCQRPSMPMDFNSRSSPLTRQTALFQQLPIPDEVRRMRLNLPLIPLR